MIAAFRILVPFSDSPALGRTHGFVEWMMRPRMSRRRLWRAGTHLVQIRRGMSPKILFDK